MSEYTLPFMQQGVIPYSAGNNGVGLNSTGNFNMGMWGQQPASTGVQQPTIMPGQFGMPNAAGSGGWWDKMGGMQGLNQGISAFSNLAGIYAGFKSLGLAKDQFKFAKSSFNKNFNASAQAYNNQLKDKHEQRKNVYESRGRSYEGMGSWMSDREIQKVGKTG